MVDVVFDFSWNDRNIFFLVNDFTEVGSWEDHK